MGRHCGGWVSLLKALHQLSMNTYSTIFLVNFNFLLFFENSLPKAGYCLQIARTCPKGQKSALSHSPLRVDVQRKIRKKYLLTVKTKGRLSNTVAFFQSLHLPPRLANLSLWRCSQVRAALSQRISVVDYYYYRDWAASDCDSCAFLLLSPSRNRWGGAETCFCSRGKARAGSWA